MQLIISNSFELLAFTLLCLAVVIRHNYLQRNLRKLDTRHADAPLAWWIALVLQRDTNSSDRAKKQRLRRGAPTN